MNDIRLLCGQVAKADSTVDQASSREVFDPAVALFTGVRQVADEVLHAHEDKVGRISRILAIQMGLSRSEVVTIARASSLHDIGKFGIPKCTLGKQGPLDPEEIKEIQRHAEHGAQILIRSGMAPDDLAVLVARHHHEKFDGSGYPTGRAGTDIPLAARITAVADVYDALRALRPYKDPIDHDTAMSMILEGNAHTRPGHFDPEVLHAFWEARDRIRGDWESDVRS